MSLGKKRGAAKAVPYINVTPLIDVLLVMLIIFMVITPLKPSRFQADVPTPPDKDAPNQKTEANPLTLVVGISGAAGDLKIKLNNHDSPIAGEPCFGVVPNYGSVNEPGNLAKCLSYTLQQRREHRIYKDIYKVSSPPSMPEDQKIEKTVFIKAPRTLTYGNVVKVIDAIKGAGANPVGLQVDGLDNN
jgi:biopolymer transport protein ExbD